MKTKTHGFVALFLVLGISSTLLALVVLSSTSVFEYVHAKRDFDETYQRSFASVTCADTYIDFVVRGLKVKDLDFSRQLFYGDQVMCHIRNARIVNISPDVQRLFFTSDLSSIEIEIRNGFVIIP